MAMGLPKASLASSTIAWSWELGLPPVAGDQRWIRRRFELPSLHDPSLGWSAPRRNRRCATSVASRGPA